jgi:hypothetical protein
MVDQAQQTLALEAVVAVVQVLQEETAQVT